MFGQIPFLAVVAHNPEFVIVDADEVSALVDACRGDLVVVMLQLFHDFIFCEIGEDFVDFYCVKEVIGCLAQTSLAIYAFAEFAYGCVAADLLVSHEAWRY